MRKIRLCGQAALLLSISFSEIATAEPPAFKAELIREAKAPTTGAVIPLTVQSDRPLALKGSELPEQWYYVGAQLGVRNVIHPTLTYFAPTRGQPSGVAVIIAPGGGFNSLAWSNEGEPIAIWLADHGISAFVLKYRTIATPRDTAGYVTFVRQQMGRLQKGGFRALPLPVDARADAHSAVSYVRANSAKYKVNPSRIGFLGFSAGAVVGLGATVSSISADRPNFLGLIYGPMFAQRIPESPPPLFAAKAIDDPLYKPVGTSLEDNFGLIRAWRARGGSVEMHLYSGGSHGFGAQTTGTTSEGWREDFLAWLCAQNFCGNSAE